MSRKTYIPYLILLFLLLCQTTWAQNLVPNPSFEKFVTCPSGTTEPLRSSGNWYRYTHATPDYLSQCTGNKSEVGYTPKNKFGYQVALNGTAYAGIYTYHGYSSWEYREYAATPIQPLTIGTKYCMAISVSLVDSASYASDGLGVYFFDKAPDSILYFPLNALYEKCLSVKPQISYQSYGIISDRINWVRLISSFTADSTYDHLVIGCFNDDAHIKLTYYPNICSPSSWMYKNAYYYVDSVVLTKLSISSNYPSIKTCAGDTVNVPYTLSGEFNISNIFMVQLSNSTGSFVNPVTIGTVNSNVAGSIKCAVPFNLAAGNQYRIRILSTDIPIHLSPRHSQLSLRPIS